MRNTFSTISMILAIAGGAEAANAQASMSPRAHVPGGGSAVVAVPNDPMLNPDSPEARAYAALQREKRIIEREMRLIRRRHFGSMRNIERRETGMRKLREFTDPPALILMTELFDRENEDVREAVLDHFSSLKNDHGDAALAWEGVHGRDEWYRARARAHLVMRLTDGPADGSPDIGGVSTRVRGVIAAALTGEDDTAAVAAGRLAGALKLYEFIPMMASAQVAPRGGGQERTGDLGWIMIGQQKSFVADLVPVVSNNAVGLDPQIGVVSDGVMLRVHDAVVTVYRTELYHELVAMTSAAWGRPTHALGYDAGAWRRWYADEFVPHLNANAGDVSPTGD